MYDAHNNPESITSALFSIFNTPRWQEVKEEEDEEAVSDAEEESVLEMKAGLEGAEDCGGEEDAEGVYLSEPEGETELDPPASESEDGCSMHTASSSLQLHTTADSIPSSPASSQLYVLKINGQIIAFRVKNIHIFAFSRHF